MNAGPSMSDQIILYYSIHNMKFVTPYDQRQCSMSFILGGDFECTRAHFKVKQTIEERETYIGSHLSAQGF